MSISEIDVLVTGASSPLGDYVLPRLSTAYGRIMAIARSVDTERALEKSGVHALRLDLDDIPESLPVHAHTVLHLAGIRFSESAVSLARAVSAGRLVVTSSASATAQGHPSAEKIRGAEERLRAGAPSLAVLRPTMIYGGSRDRNVRRLYHLCRRLRRVPRLSGGGLIMPVFVDDVVSATLETLITGFEGTRAVGGPHALRLGDLVDELCHAACFPRFPIKVPLSAASRLAAISGARNKSAHAVRMLATDRVVNAPHLEGFEYTPTSLEDGIGIAVARYERG